jgi:hypothetical protein
MALYWVFLRYDERMDLQTLLLDFVTFLNKTIIPFLFALALLMFIWNATRYFIIGGSNEESQQKARSLAIWGITAFVIITAFWGIITLITGSLGVDTIRSIRPDYMYERKPGDGPREDSFIVDPNTGNAGDGFENEDYAGTS